MRRPLRFAACVATVLAVALIAWHTRPTAAEPTTPSTRRASKPASPSLPITQVVLFSSGVGYFQREGDVEGNARIDQAFPATDVNDLLKSLVLQDLGGGKISPIHYDGPDPIEKTLKSFALDLTTNPTFGQVLNQARGEKIELTTQPTGNTTLSTLTGTIMGMEVRRGSVTEGEFELLNLLCGEGMRSVPLNHIQRVRFLNPVLDAELKRALEVLAATHDSQKKTVSLNFNGDGKRSVRVGYVVENPIWKTSYRLVLDKDGKPQLQGWAVVENNSDEDWKDVRMSLISGRPISFQMDLYQPLYVPRPVVEPELFASLRPPTYSGALVTGQFGNLGIQGGNLGIQGGNLGAQGGVFGGGFQGGFGALGTGPTFNPYQRSAGQLGGMQAQPKQELDENGNPKPAPQPGRLTYEELEKRRLQKLQTKEEARKVGSTVAALDPSQSIEALASSEAVGDHYQYVIDQKITLPRQKSALIPIVNDKIEATRVSIFNEGVHAKFPLLGLKFKNTSTHHLSQGPITIYEGGTYAGDSRILDLQPGEERLLSYGIDLGTEIKSVVKNTPDLLLVDGRVVKDVMQASYKMRQTRSYLIRNRSENDRLLVIEHPIRSEWKLAGPEKPVERSRDMYRFQVAVAAGKLARLDVVEEQGRVDSFAANSSDEQAVHYQMAPLAADVQIVSQKQPDQLLTVKIAKGYLGATYRARETRTYVLRNLADQDRTFVIEHLARPHWKLAGVERPKDGTEPVLRLRVSVAAGATVKQDVLEELMHYEDTAMKILDDRKVRSYLESGISSPSVKDGLRKTLDYRAKLGDTEHQRAELEGQMKSITDEQVRLRANLKEMPQMSAAYKRYLEKFDKQETEIEKLQADIKKFQATEKQQHKEYDDYVAGLKAD